MNLCKEILGSLVTLEELFVEKFLDYAVT